MSNIEFSNRGIPILSVQKKVGALQYCLEEGAHDDAMAHLFDLMAKVQPSLPTKVGGQKPWGRRVILDLFKQFGSNPTEIRDAM